MTELKKAEPIEKLTDQKAAAQKRDRWISIITLVIILAIWVFVSEMRYVRSLFLPAPQDLWAAFQRLSGNLPVDIFDSVLRRILPGFLLGAGLGTLLGVLMAMSRTGRAIFNPIVEILRPLPPLALIPLLILWLGIGNITQVLLIAYGSLIIMVVNSYEAVRNVPPIYIHAATTLGASQRQIFQRVIVPSIIPDIFGGIRVSVAASFGYCVAAELMGAMTGLGYRLTLARRYLYTENIIVILVIIALLSFLFDYGIRRANDGITSWKSRLDR